MTQKQIMLWYRTALGPVIREALAKNTGVIYTEDWLAAMAYRETWTVISKHEDKVAIPSRMHDHARGDYGKRPGEDEFSYHGYGYWQIDIGSYPLFIRSGDWKDPLLCCLKAIQVLEEKRKYLQTQYGLEKLDEVTGHRSITAAYNCGQGNVLKALKKGYDVDRYTHGGDYSQKVWAYRALYRNL